MANYCTEDKMIPNYDTVELYSSQCVNQGYGYGQIQHTRCISCHPMDEQIPWTHTDDKLFWKKFTSGIAFVVCLLVIFLMCRLRKKIVLTMGSSKGTRRVLSQILGIMFLLLFQEICTVLFLLIILVYTVYVAGIGDITMVSEESNGYTITFKVSS